MRTLIVKLCLIFILTCLGQGMALADAYDDGVAAYKKNGYASALKSFRLAAEQGHAQAQIMLGIMYERGQGVAQDYSAALKWYRLVAEHGVAIAQAKLGVMYAEGQGVAQDYSAALKWTRLAAVQGQAEAQCSLGFMYQQGQGVAQDYARAHMWFNLAAAQGNPPAQKSRDLIAAKITPQQVDHAQQLARECLQKKYRNCD